jgi:putative MFS transporter
MIVGMALIALGIALAFWGLLPRAANETRRRAREIQVRALDDAKIRPAHVAMLIVMALAVTIDVMKPTTLSFVVPGVAHEYGLRTAANPHALIPASWLPLSGITGTAIGSLIWGAISDRIGRRSSILFAAILFVSTAICGAMPGFWWNVAMCFAMGIGAGGMLPIAFTLISETIPARHRGWLIVLIGGDVAGAYVITSWLAGALTPHYGWRILWLLGLPTGLLLVVLNRWIPESPRYLLASGRTAEAEAVMRRYGAAVVTGTDDVPEAAAAPNARFVDLLRRPFVTPMVAIGALCVSIGLLTYGFQFWVPTNLQHLGLTGVTSDYILRDSALLGLPLTAVAAVAYGFWSSRGTIVVLSLVTGASVGVFAVLGDRVVDHRGLLTLLLVVPLAGISSAAAVVVDYASEVFPTGVRSRATGVAAGLTKTGGVLVLALAVGAVSTPSLATTALIGAIPLVLAAIVFGWHAPESSRQRLEDITRAELAVQTV